MKPTWNNAPSWANYLAMDGDGCLVAFECKPNRSRRANIWDRSSGKCKVMGIFEPPLDWRDTLEARPQEIER